MPSLQHLATDALRLRLQFGRMRRHGLTLAVGMVVLASCLLPGTVQAAVGENARLCDRAARAAAQAEGVPLDVLQAIARTETGRSGESGLQPWPWTVNMEGIGKWFATEDEARAYVFAHFKRGARSFDVGCFQINYRWHGEAFRSIDEMFDPTLNARYAARFLMRLYEEFGDWSAAAGAYHSRTPEHARSYTAKFERIRSAIPDGSRREVAEADTPDRPRGPQKLDLARTEGRVPFIGQGSVALGSLVPVTVSAPGAARVFIALE